MVLRDTWSGRALRRVGLLCALVLSVVLPVRATAISPSTAIASRGMISLAGVLPPIVAQGRATPLGAVAATTTLAIVIPLALRNAAGLTSFVQAVTDPSSPHYRQYVSLSQAVQRYGPSALAAQAVVAWARGQGIAAVSSTPFAVHIQATVGQINALFGVRITHWRSATGRVFFAPQQAPSIPAVLASSVVGVLGLDNASTLQPMLRRAPRPSRLTKLLARPKVGSGPVVGGYTPTELRGAYNLTPVLTAGVIGQGQSIDLFELDSYTPTDVLNYDVQYGITTTVLIPNLCQSQSTSLYTCTPNQTATAPGSGVGEVESDIEVVQAIAPGAIINVYQDMTNSDVDAYNLYATMLQAGDANIISSSWGQCELNSSPSYVHALDQLFQLGAAAGIGVYSAAGDAGSLDCYGNRNPTGPNAMALSVDYPASDPYVTAVGGTSLTLGTTAPPTYGGETAWNASTASGGTLSASAGGGGVSSVFAQPFYQSGLAPPGSSAALVRMVPDVAANADPNTGYSIFTAGGWAVIGGTSLATPLWAAIMVLADQRANRHLGFINPTLYNAIARVPARAATDVHDVTVGDNDPLDSLGSNSSPHYVAASGYDLATGWGSPNGANLISDLVAISGTTGTATPTPTFMPSPTPTPSPTPSGTPAMATPTPTVPVPATGIPLLSTPSVTDLSSAAFAVIFTSTTAITAALQVVTQTGGPPFVVYDDRDINSAAVASTIHRFSVAGLTASTTYVLTPLLGPVGAVGTAITQMTPARLTTSPVPPLVAGTAQFATGSLVPYGLALLVGYILNPSSGATSAPLSTLATSTIAGNGLNYSFNSSPRTADGTTSFVPASNAVFIVTGWGDDNGNLASGPPVSGALGSLSTTEPTVILGMPQNMATTVQVGWNLISLPLLPMQAPTAQSILGKVMANPASQLAELASWTGTNWQVALLQRGSVPTSDFSLALGRGYFLYSDQPSVYTTTGLSLAQSVTTTLVTGWNLIGVPAPSSGETSLNVLAGVASAGAQPLEMAAWTGTGWQVTLAGQSSSPFPIRAGAGYFIYAQQNAIWTAQ